jgi:hypothetical protein
VAQRHERLTKQHHDPLEVTTTQNDRAEHLERNTELAQQAETAHHHHTHLHDIERSIKLTLRDIERAEQQPNQTKTIKIVVVAEPHEHLANEQLPLDLTLQNPHKTEVVTRVNEPTRITDLEDRDNFGEPAVRKPNITLEQRDHATREQHRGTLEYLQDCNKQNQRNLNALPTFEPETNREPEPTKPTNELDNLC